MSKKITQMYCIIIVPTVLSRKLFSTMSKGIQNAFTEFLSLFIVWYSYLYNCITKYSLLTRLELNKQNM